MTAIEEKLRQLERAYEDGLFLSARFCDEVIAVLAVNEGAQYDLKTGLSANTISRIVREMNLMRSAANSGDPVISVDNSAKVHDHTAKIPQYLAVAGMWEAAKWIKLTTLEDGLEGWQPTPELLENDHIASTDLEGC